MRIWCRRIGRGFDERDLGWGWSGRRIRARLLNWLASKCDCLWAGVASSCAGRFCPEPDKAKDKDEEDKDEDEGGFDLEG